MSIFSAAWRTIQLFMNSAAFAAAFQIAQEVIPEVEAAADAAKAAGEPMTSREKHQVAFDLVEAGLAERGYSGARFVFVAIEFALDHMGYFVGKTEAKPSA
jgi:siroheme synthase